ncbi:VanZ family protein [Polaribacter sp. P097]|uniref:VanZ family protein n=1 Tax=Polaribacter sp. P097 TaxID=3117398 RepID=UPI002FE3068C
MLKRIKVLLLDNFIFIAITFTITIVGLSLFKLPSKDIGVKNVDKIYHLIAYFSLAFAWLVSFYQQKSKKMLIVLACVVFGIIIEVLQSALTNYRTGDYLDVFANTLGVLLALLFFNAIFKKKQIN